MIIMASEIKIDWERYFTHNRTLAISFIKDEKTGLKRQVIPENALNKYIEKLTTVGRSYEASKSSGEAFQCTRSAEEVRRAYIEGQGTILITDEDLYKRNPEFWQRFLLE
jgi:hypothetical protein